MSNRSNSKVVKEIIRNHILECIEQVTDDSIENLKAFKNQLEINASGANKHTIYIDEVIKNTLMGCYGSFEFTYDGIINFINDLDLNNNSNKKFDIEDYENMYYRLIGRECLYLFKKNDIEIERVFSK